MHWLLSVQAPFAYSFALSGSASPCPMVVSSCQLEEQAACHAGLLEMIEGTRFNDDGSSSKPTSVRRSRDRRDDLVEERLRVELAGEPSPDLLAEDGGLG